MVQVSKFRLNFQKRGVAPIIANLLLIAIAVVGGTIFFSFSEGFFSAAQISGTTVVESISILGYDARATSELKAHDGNIMSLNSGGNTNPTKEFDERIAIYVTSNTPHNIAIAELSFGGTIYNYTTIPGNSVSDWDDVTDLTPGKYSMLTKSPGLILFSDAPRIQSGQTVTFLIDLDSDFKIGRSSQFKITTTNGGVFVGTIFVGQQVG